MHMSVYWQVLAEKVHIKALTIAQRVQLLQDGLNDRSGKYILEQEISLFFKEVTGAGSDQNGMLFSITVEIHISCS